MPFYENVFIARQDVSATQVETLTEQFATIIQEQGGKTKEEAEQFLIHLTLQKRYQRDVY